MNALIKQPLPPLSTAAIEALRSLSGESLTGIIDASRHSKSGKAVVAIFNSVCTGCQSGDLVATLNRYAEKRPDVKFLALLPQDYSSADLENFKSNLGVKFDTERVGATLSREFGKLVSSYGQSRVNGMVILIDRGSLTVIENPADVNHKLSSW